MAESRVSTHAIEVLNSGGVSNARVSTHGVEVLISEQLEADVLDDPHWANVVLRLRFDGAILDDTGRHTDWIGDANGLPYISPTGGKFGGYNTGKGNPGEYGYGIEQSTVSADFVFGLDDFTFEGWFWKSSPQTYGGNIFGMTNGLSFRLYCLSNGQLGLQMGSDGTTANIINTTTGLGFVSQSGWTHLCLERHNGVFRLYVNGQMTRKITGFESTPLYPPNLPLKLGGGVGTPEINTHALRMDDLRVTRGVARYAHDGGFLVPTRAYPVGTVVPPENIEIDTLPGGLEVAGSTPGVVAATNVNPVAGELVVQGATPSLVVDEFVATLPGELIFTGSAPTISSTVNVLNGDALQITGGTPSLYIGTVILTTQPAALEVTGSTPAIFSELASIVSQQATLTLAVPPPPEVRATQQAVLTAAKVIPPSNLSQFGALTLGKVIPPIKVTQMANMFLVKPVIQPAILPEPEVGGKETWTWLTDTLVADDGTEQRIALRDHPRRSFSEKIIYDDYELVTRHVQFMMDRFGETFVLPLYHYRVKLTLPPQPNDNYVYFDTSRMDVRPGAYVYLYDGELFQLCRVVRVFDNRVYVDLPILYDFSNNVRVMPCAVCVASNNTSFDRKNPDYYGTMTLNAEEVVVTPFIRDGNVQTLTTYDDLPVLNKRPIGTEFDSAHDTGLERIDYSTGPVSLRNPWKHSQNVLNRRFIVHRRRPEDLDWWKRLADYAKGSQKPFLLPSGRQDFEIVTPAAQGGKKITVDGIRYGPSFFGHNAFRRIAISSAAGVHYATVWSATREGDKNVLHFTPPYPTGPGWSQGQQVSFLLQVRIGDDKVELEHDRLHSFVDLNLRTVDDA